MDKIICAGKNYLEHAHEMKDGVPEKPVLFLKPPSVLKNCPHWNDTVMLTLPKNAGLGDIHYECELVFLISKSGYDFSEAEAHAALTHVTVGLDMTHRTLQRQAKDKGAPWEVGKVFPDAAVVGPWLPFKENDVTFELQLNGVRKQHAKLSDMRMSPVELLVYASQHFPICAGDMLFTGTPAGVGAVKAGDVAQLTIQSHSYSVRWQ